MLEGNELNSRTCLEHFFNLLEGVERARENLTKDRERARWFRKTLSNKSDHAQEK